MMSVSFRAVRLSQLAPETAVYSFSRSAMPVSSMKAFSRMLRERESRAFTVTSST